MDYKIENFVDYLEEIVDMEDNFDMVDYYIYLNCLDKDMVDL